MSGRKQWEEKHKKLLNKKRKAKHGKKGYVCVWAVCCEHDSVMKQRHSVEIGKDQKKELRIPGLALVFTYGARMIILDEERLIHFIHLP